MYCFAYFMVTKYIYKIKIDTVLFIFFSRKIESTTLLIFFFCFAMKFGVEVDTFW